jgi:osmotically-inducible protein OsmY
VSERGVVYLMGLVTREEEAAVLHKIRYIQGVQRVVKTFEYL